MAVFGIQLGSKQKIFGVQRSDTKGIGLSSTLSTSIAHYLGYPALLALLLVYGADVGLDQHSSITYMVVGRQISRSSLRLMAEIKFNNCPPIFISLHRA